MAVSSSGRHGDGIKLWGQGRPGQWVQPQGSCDLSFSLIHKMELTVLTTQDAYEDYRISFMKATCNFSTCFACIPDSLN